MDIFLAQLFNGLAVGSIYALLVTGFNLLLLVGGIIYYSYPHIVVMNMYIAWGVLKYTGNNILIAVPVTIGSAMILIMVTEPLFRPLAKRKAVNQSFVLSIAIGLILTHVMSKYINRGYPVSFPETLSSNEASIQIGTAVVSQGQLFTFVGTLLAVVTFMFFLYRTMTGRAFRAMAQNLSIAKLLGVPIRKMAFLSYGVAGLLGGITAIFLAMALGSAYPSLGDMLAIKVIATVLFAGLGNLKGGLICGLILGVTECMATGYIAGQWSEAVSFGMVMVVVFFRPKGLFNMKA
jgi:branched-chain amino acid transport system permease protein